MNEDEKLLSVLRPVRALSLGFMLITLSLTLGRLRKEVQWQSR